MALPIILVNATGGSDSTASGAGPATAITGSAGVSLSTTVTLDGSPDLSGLIGDGSEVIYFADATAGNRNFSKITAFDNTAKTVTVSVAFTAGTKAWAIGGKRASIASATSLKLWDNNSTAGDAAAGWVVEMQSGHTETIAAQFIPRRAGDTTSGYIELRGTAGAGTIPILTFSNNGEAIRPNVGYLRFRDFEMRNTNATKTASIAFSGSLNVTGPVTIRNIKINHTTNKFWKGITPYQRWLVRGCEIGSCASHAIDTITGIGVQVITNCWLHNNGGSGINIPADPVGVVILGNLITFNSGDGITAVMSGSTSRVVHFIGNTIHGNGGDGIEVTGTPLSVCNALIVNNIFSYNGGYDLKFSDAAATATYLAASMPLLAGNTYFGSTSGKYLPTDLAISENESTIDPSGGLASATKDYAGTTGGSNFMVVSAVKGLSYPLGGTLSIGTTSSTYSYADPGVAQRQESTPPISKVTIIQNIGTY